MCTSFGLHSEMLNASVNQNWTHCSHQSLAIQVAECMPTPIDPFQKYYSICFQVKKNYWFHQLVWLEIPQPSPTSIIFDGLKLVKITLRCLAPFSFSVSPASETLPLLLQGFGDLIDLLVGKRQLLLAGTDPPDPQTSIVSGWLQILDVRWCKITNCNVFFEEYGQQTSTIQAFHHTQSYVLYDVNQSVCFFRAGLHLPQTYNRPSWHPKKSVPNPASKPAFNWAI